MLTERSVSKITAQPKPQKKADQGGLYLYVTQQGAKSWRYDYRFGGKRFTLTLGLYPDVSLKDARRKHREARTQLADDKNPVQQKKQKKILQRAALDNTFDEVGTAWFASKAERPRGSDIGDAPILFPGQKPELVFYEGDWLVI